MKDREELAKREMYRRWQEQRKQQLDLLSMPYEEEQPEVEHERNGITIAIIAVVVILVLGSFIWMFVELSISESSARWLLVVAGIIGMVALIGVLIRKWRKHV